MEGFHAIKHALRFGARLNPVVTAAPDKLARLGRQLAPDVVDEMMEQAQVIDYDLLARLVPVPPNTAVVALAPRPAVAAASLWSARRSAPLVVLENPTHLGNVGAVIRGAAAAGAAGVITTGPHDPWHPAAVRGAAGLQFALPVARADSLPPQVAGPIIGLHPEGELLTPAAIADDTVLVFGSERRGLSEATLSRLHGRLAIPMAPGVSSLNLATSVAVALYTWRLNEKGGSPPPGH